MHHFLKRLGWAHLSPTVATEHDIPVRSLRRYVGESLNEPRSVFFYKDVSDIQWRLDGFQALTPPPPPALTNITIEEDDDRHKKLMLETMVDMIGHTDRDGMVWVPLWYAEFMMNNK